MQLAIILAIVGTLMASEHAPHAAVTHAGWRLFLVAVAAATVVVIAWTIASAAVRARVGGKLPEVQIWQDFNRRRQFHTFAWLAASVAIVVALKWPQLAMRNWTLDQWWPAAELLILLPVLLPLLVSWAVFYGAEQAWMPACHASAWRDRLRYVNLHVRHYLLLPLVPVLALLIVRDVAQLGCPWLLESDYAWLVYAVPLALIIIWFPYLIQTAFSATSLPPGRLRHRLETAAGRFGLRVRDILIWNTDGRMVNAAVAGWLPGHRYIFLSDGLLLDLTEEEIEDVFAHEAGHVRHCHTLCRTLVLLTPVCLWLAATSGQPVAAISTALAQYGIRPPLPGGLIAAALAIAYPVIVLGWYSRLLEHQADVWACRQDTGAHPSGGFTRQAAERYIKTLEKLVGGDPARRRRCDWLHPSFERRAHLLRQLASDRRQVSRFQLRVSMAGVLLAVLATSPIVVRLLVA